MSLIDFLTSIELSGNPSILNLAETAFNQAR
jgi:hypothetical protein